MPDPQPPLLVAANRLHHCGYTTPIMYCRQRDVLIGMVEGVGEEIRWQAVDLVAFRTVFMAQVDDYLRRQERTNAAGNGGSAFMLM